MDVSVQQCPAVNERSFHPFLKELARFQTTRELERSDLYLKLKADIEDILEQVWHEQLVEAPEGVLVEEPIRAIGWNIERGMRADAAARILREHPALNGADVLLLSELDWGMARTGNRFVARDLAQAIGMNYAFAPCYIALTKGAGVEKN